MEHGNWFSLGIVGILSGLILWKILSARRGRELFIRKIPGVDAIDEAVGRATEMGRPILFSTGLGGLDIVTLQALAIVGRVARLAAQYRTRLILPMVDTVVLPIAEEICREAYNEAGQPEAFNPDDVRFLSGSQFAYASGVVGIMNRERVSANFMFGSFFAEALILAETGQSVGAVQVAGTPSTLQVPFFIVSCDYTIIGEEYYATSAYLTREPTLLGSLVGQDYGKILLGVAIALGVLAAVFLGKIYHQPTPPQPMTIAATTLPRPPAGVQAQGLLQVSRPWGPQEVTVNLPLKEGLAGTLLEKFLVSPTAGPKVSLAVRLARTGDYVLWARIGVQQGKEDAFDVQVDEGTATPCGGKTVEPDQQWSWVRVGSYPLQRGKHRIEVVWRTPQGRLDRLVLCQAKPWPQENPQALAFHAASVAGESFAGSIVPEKVVASQGALRFPFKMHREGHYRIWLRLGPAPGRETLPRMQVRLDHQPAIEPTVERAGQPPSTWVATDPLTLTAGEQALTVEWLEEAALYEIVVGQPEFDPAATSLAPYYADYVPDDLSANDFLIEPLNSYLRLWQRG